MVAFGVDTKTAVMPEPKKTTKYSRQINSKRMLPETRKLLCFYEKRVEKWSRYGNASLRILFKNPEKLDID